MPKKFYSWEFWDWGSILDTILMSIFIIGIVAFFYSGPRLIRERELKKLDAETTAKVISLKKYESTGLWDKSSTIYLEGLVITYNYIVNDIVYSRWEVIPNNNATGRFEYRLLTYPESTIHIKYSTKNPANSLIVVDSL